jgi:hypothetical protein
MSNPADLMKAMLAAAVSVFLGTAAASPNLLVDPGFESKTSSPTGVGGWWLMNGASFWQGDALTVRSGSFSLREVYDPSAPSNEPYSQGLQLLPATPGTAYVFSGYARIPFGGMAGGSATGILLVGFWDASDNLLGNLVASPDPLGFWSPEEVWLTLSLSATAPAGAAKLSAAAVLWNPAAGNTLFWDDLSLTVVPEPSSLGLLGLGVGSCLLVGRRR